MKENLLPYYPSYYINEDGTEVYRKNSFISSKGKIYQKNKGSDWYKLRIKVCSDGRPKVNLWKDNHRVKVRIQRLVALAWIPNPENKPFVCHKDNNPLNNHYKNLYWGTPKENAQQCIRDGRFSHNSTPGKIGQDSPTSKYSNRLKLRVFRYKRRHPEILLRELSTKFKMPLSVISKIIKGIDPITKPYL